MSPSSNNANKPWLSRRRFLAGAGALVGAGAGAKLFWDRVGGPSEAVFVANASRYDESLVGLVRQGLTELGIGREQVAGKSILLKPNLVEPSLEAPHINTHPRLVVSVAEVFRGWDAREVIVGEGQGHCRDSFLVLEQSGLGPLLDEARIPFVDLNHDDVFVEPNRLGVTGLTHFYLPAALKRADLVVSMPKLKTHHWVGMTLSMKNLFGVLPGICYGWPKNVLHQAGIARSIVDIYAAVRPRLAIVDGIVGMEGDGPIMGSPRQANLLLMGTNLPAVDATGARLMGFDPRHIPYLGPAERAGLGPVSEGSIEQRGETIRSLAQEFELLDHPQMKQFRPS